MPFMTEELWSRLRPPAGSIMVAPWPAPEGTGAPEAEATLERFQDLVTALRRLRADHGIPPSTRMTVMLQAGAHAGEMRELSDAVVALARLESLELADELPPPSGHARALTPAGIEASVRLGDVIDVVAERERLEARIAEAGADAARSERKLANPEFVSKAPEAVVSKERSKLDAALAARAKLEQQLRSLQD
jgi:valyl-tRNA synthetase